MTGGDELRANARRQIPVAALILGSVALFVAVRCVHLAADTPEYVGSHFARELFAEPPAKAQEARNFALFGAFAVNPIDNYQFWRAQSPVWVYPLAQFFSAFGVDYPQLRVFSTLYSALGLIALLALAAPVLRRGAVLFAGLALALDPVYFHYSRVGLLEPAVSAWLSLCMLALVRAKERLGYLLLAHVAFVAAYFTKQAALFALPVVLIGSVMLLLPPAQTPHAARVKRIVWLQLAVLALAVAAYVSTDAYQRSVVHNINHVMLGADDKAQHRWYGLGSLVFRITDPARYGHFWLSVPIIGPMALATVGVWLARAVRERRIDFFKLVTGLWFVCACLAMLVIAKSALRFWTVVVPPAALVAAAGLDEALSALARWGRPRAAHAALALALLGVLAFDLRGLTATLLHPTFRVRDAAAAIEQQIGAREAAIVGFESPGIVLGTPYENYFVRRKFNSNRQALEGLGITHVLARQKRESTRKTFDRELPGAWKRFALVMELEARGTRYRLLEVGDALKRSEKAAQKVRKRID